MTLCVIHPHDPVARALAQTLETLWNGPVTAATRAPERPDDATVYLAPPGTALGPERMVALEGQKLAALIAAAAAKFRALSSPRLLSVANGTLDTVTRDFAAGTRAATLTEKEAAVLIYLSQRGTPATRDDLLRDVWQYAADADTHTIETHIYRLRQKIETDPENPRILLTQKEGYQLAAASKA